MKTKKQIKNLRRMIENTQKYFCQEVMKKHQEEFHTEVVEPNPVEPKTTVMREVFGTDNPVIFMPRKGTYELSKIQFDKLYNIDKNYGLQKKN